MKTGVIIKLLVMMYTVCARLELCDIKEIEENSFNILIENLLINPDGPLNPLRGYIFHKNRLIYNKRLLSSWIETDYSLKKHPDSSERTGRCNFVFKRHPENDKPYISNNTISASNTELEYLSEFHQQMIYMFPCASGSIFIEPCRNDSFTRLLRAHSNKSDSIYLLAALLVLSEGVDIPIEIDKSIERSKRIFLKREITLNNDFVFINMPLWLESFMPDGTKKKVYQKEAEDIVLFFKKLYREPFLSKVKKREEPDSKEEFYNGDFLDSPKFLIQSYVFEYIDSIEEYRQFISAVQVFLMDFGLYPGITEEQKEHINKIKDHCFIGNNPHNTIKNTYAADIYNIKIKIDNEAILPFTCPITVPSYTRVPENIPENIEDLVQDELLQYSDRVETMLLNLFTCLTYNPETNKCSAENMPGASTTLIEFFNKYSV
ncbi:hypothetical protein NEIRO03_2482, partial [Nematocida sp. AWRm78]